MISYELKCNSILEEPFLIYFLDFKNYCRSVFMGNFFYTIS